MQSGIAKMVNLMVDFVEHDFEAEAFEEQEQELSGKIQANLGKCDAVVQERLAIIEQEIGKLQTVVQCPSCLQRAMNADGGTMKCIFCHYSAEPSESAEECVTNVLAYPAWFRVEKDGGQWPIRICPERGHDAFVTAILGGFDPYALDCFNCGVEYDSTEPDVCYDCGEYYHRGGEAGSTSVQVVFMGEYRMTMSRSTHFMGRQKDTRVCSPSRVAIRCRCCEIGRWT